MFKHDAIVRAWLDGKTIQTRQTPNNAWREVHSYANSGYCPAFGASEEYRIKPETIKYRVALFRYHVVSCIRPDYYDEYEKLDSFVRWVTPEIEVEI